MIEFAVDKLMGGIWLKLINLKPFANLSISGGSRITK